jgi:hypothetical protein
VDGDDNDRWERNTEIPNETGLAAVRPLWSPPPLPPTPPPSPSPLPSLPVAAPTTATYWLAYAPYLPGPDEAMIGTGPMSSGSSPAILLYPQGNPARRGGAEPPVSPLPLHTTQPLCYSPVSQTCGSSILFLRWSLTENRGGGGTMQGSSKGEIKPIRSGAVRTQLGEYPPTREAEGTSLQTLVSPVACGHGNGQLGSCCCG